MKPPANSSPAPAHIFTGYQKFVIAVLAFLQFTIMLDFMILSPLGAILLSELHITTSQFGLVVSSYAIAAGISGILAAGFADRYDRKRLLLFFYAGFVLGTALCGIAPNFHTLLFARIVTGVFGGVVGSVSLAIVADLFPVAVRGRVMGFIMSAFAGAQVLGIPIGILLATRLGWHAPFIMVAAVSLLVGGVIFARLQPIDAHLKIVVKRNPLEHLWETAKSPRYITGFLATMLLATGGFMLMPFGSAFTVHNLGIPLDRLPTLYMITGVCSLILGPLLGRLSDRIGKYQMFCYATVVGIGVVLYYTHLGLSPFWMLVVISIVLFGSISGRMVAAGALTSAIPNPADRGAYMSISSSLQQFAGGMASMIAGTIVVQSPEGKLLHYPLLGWVVSGAMFVAMLFMYRVHQLVTSDAKTKFQVGGNPELAATET
jgi:predicted MFS family arabinose efflux permease